MPQLRTHTLHPEDVDELLAQMPGWPLRWGISLMFGVVMLLLGLAWFVKYPDVIKGRITITTSTPPATVVARAGGNIHLLVIDKTLLNPNQAFATIGGNTRYDDVVALRQALVSFQVILDSNQLPPESARSSTISLPDRLELGELQEPYNALQLRWKEWQALAIRNTSNQKRKGIVNDQIGGFDQIRDGMNRQLALQ